MAQHSSQQLGEWFAHSPNPEGEWHLLENHLSSVAQISGMFAHQFECSNLGLTAGFLHDAGKFNPDFQDYLRLCVSTAETSVKPRSVPHSIYGGSLAAQSNLPVMAFPLAGHHGGLTDPSTLKSRLADAGNPEWLKNARDFLSNRMPASAPVPDWANQPLACEFLIRMLFSCLVDADWLDTERHFDATKSYKRWQPSPLDELWTRFQENQALLLAQAIAANSLVNQVRREVYEACLDAAEGERGVYRLTVPTGGGKTRSGLAFALRHAVKHGLKRVIVAIPYTSIIDQTADVYQAILGPENVLEHHSAIEFASDPTEQQTEAEVKRRLAAENWDAPIVVTTTVQLFDSLFANKPSRCRKLHNIAGSVLILDEVQTLPLHLLKPILDVLKELVAHYGVTLVLSTATQPAFSGDSPYLRGFNPAPVEIVPNPERFFRSLKRVDYEVIPEPWTWERVAEEIKKHRQALCVVNSRKDALTLFNLLDDPNALHLSTLMCPMHRKATLAEIRRRLDAKEPCIVISTQVVEAGVDLDFPVVLRAMGPLDRIVQAGGRCNREGLLACGKVIVFEPADGHTPRGSYATAIAEARTMIAGTNANLHDPGVFDAYFRRLWQDCNLDVPKIQTSRGRLDYPEVAEKFKMIDDATMPVIVQYGEPGPEEALNAVRAKGSIAGGDWRNLQLYAVNIYRYRFEQHVKEGLVEEVLDGLYLWKGGYHARKGIAQESADPADPIT